MILEDDMQQDDCFSGDSTTAAGAFQSDPPTPTMHFVHFLSACSTRIDEPLEKAVQQSIELAQFIDASSSRSFLPHHQFQMRSALWELLYDARVREACLVEMEKQSRLYGGSSGAFQPGAHCAGAGAPPTSTVSPTTSFPCTDPQARGDGSNAGPGKFFRHASVPAEHAPHVDENALLAALRARGKFLPRAPCHASQCARRLSSLSSSHTSLHTLSARLRESHLAAAARHIPRLTAVADFSSDCALCVAEGLLEGAWVSLRCAQLISVAAAAHLCAAPLRVPREVLSTTPREAICIGHHLAQLLLRCAIGLLLTVAHPPAHEKEEATEKKCNGEGQREEENIHVTEAEQAHHAEAIAAITAIGRSGLDTCVALLSALRRLQPNSAPIVLLQAAAIAFCDRCGVSKAQRMLREWCDAQTPSPSGSHTLPVTAKSDSNGSNMKEKNLNGDGIDHNHGSDNYTAWLRLNGSEDVAIGVLFSVFLQLLSLRESPMRDAPFTDTACLSARNALDTFVHPRLLALCDAADGATSARGQQALALHWLLRGTLCHMLNALAVAPASFSATRHVPIVFDEAAPEECARAAGRAAEAAREFSTDTLAPPWMDTLDELSDPHTCDSAGDWRFPCGGSEASPRVCDNAAEDAFSVAEIALLPLPVMRMWTVLGVTVFRNASGDLFAANNADDAEGSVVNSAEEAAPEPVGTRPKMSVGGQSQVAKDVAKWENAQRMAEVQRMAEASSLAFWHRWHEAVTPMASSSSLSLDVLPVLERQRRLLLFASSEEKEENVTMFMSALRDAHPIAVSSEAAFTAARLLPHQTNKEGEDAKKGTKERIIAALDPRLDAACRRYDKQCVRSLVVDALPLSSVTSENKAASGSAMRAVQQKQRLRSTSQKRK